MPDWSQLAPDEILLALQQAAAAQQEAVSGFVDCHQYAAISPEAGLSAFGGHADAQFRRLGLSTQPTVAAWNMPAAALPPEQRAPRRLRQLLQAGGLSEWQLGDIIAGTLSVLVFALPGLDLRPIFPQAELLPAAADGSWPLPDVRTERSSLASLRVDAALASFFRVGRAEAQTAIEYGFAFHNFRPVRSKAALLKAGDQLVYRTKGRVAIVSVETNERNGRYWVEAARYPC